MTSTTHIYALIDPRTDAVRYIGKADDLEWRYRCHLNDRHKSAKSMWVKKLLGLGLYPQMRCLASIPSWMWQEAEEFYIALYRAAGVPLLNLTAGGEGSNGYEPTPEARKNISESAKKRGVSREHLDYMTARAAKCNRGKMKPCAPEIRAKIAASLRGRKLSPEAVAKKSASLKAFYKTPEGKASLARQTEQKKLRVVKPSQWMAAVAANTGKPKSPEHRARLREAWVRRKQRSLFAGVN